MTIHFSSRDDGQTEPLPVRQLRGFWAVTSKRDVQGDLGSWYFACDQRKKGLPRTAGLLVLAIVRE
jgi:hypothetical protein